MDDLGISGWAELAGTFGAGTTFILGIACVVLWRERKKDAEYIRNMQEQHIKTMAAMNNTMDKILESDGATRTELQRCHGELLQAVKDVITCVKEECRLVSDEVRRRHGEAPS